MHTACVWSEKLPFAGYSVVKDHSGGNIAPRNLSVIARRFPPDPLGSLTRGAPKPRSVRSPKSRLPETLVRGLEPAGCRELARLQWPRFKQSGEYRARTGDLLVANQALSQLS
jgi:hypothetical protein